MLKDKRACAIIHEHIVRLSRKKRSRILGYREFVKDYKIEYVEVPGRKRLKAVRVYVGPWYQFKASPERIRFLRWMYLISLSTIALLLLVPMCIDCSFTRIWYIQVPAMVAWIPLIFMACAVWRLWTAGEKVNREHNALLGPRMSGSGLFLMGFCLISFLGCFFALSVYTAEISDYVVCGCNMLAGICAISLFSHRKELEMDMVDPGQKQ